MRDEDYESAEAGSLLEASRLSYKTSGHLVTIPDPRGKKSLPTIDSSTEDLPVD